MPSATLNHLSYTDHSAVGFFPLDTLQNTTNKKLLRVFNLAVFRGYCLEDLYPRDPKKNDLS